MDTATLAPEQSAQLTEFARACKAAARAVTLYPGSHPSIAVNLERIVQITAPAKLSSPLRIEVLADHLLLDGRLTNRPDPALAELASLLHAHRVGEIVVHPGGDAEAWRSFLLLLGRAPDAVRAEGGISRLWATMAGRHVEVREIDYSEVLRERSGGLPAAWESIIANCLEGSALELSDPVIEALLEMSRDDGRLTEVLLKLQASTTEDGSGLGPRAAALLRLLNAIATAIKRSDPDQLDPAMVRMADAASRLTPSTMMALLSDRERNEREAPGLMDSLVDRMSDGTIASFVARNAFESTSAVDRLAQAFQTLVPETERQERLVALAHDEAAASSAGTAHDFESDWDQVAQKLLTSYSDKPFVPEDYARELTSARDRAVAIDELHEDPPERLSAWLGSVATNQLRRLDLLLIRDLLRLEGDQERRALLVTPIVALLEDLLLVGDFDAAQDLAAAVAQELGPQSSAERRDAASSIVKSLVGGTMMPSIVGHLATIDDAQTERVKAFCISLGEAVIRPLAETLSTEERARPRERLAMILIAFGAIGRREVERLKNSPNSAVRRTAIYLLREFGGSEALPDLTELLNDTEPQVQREAVRAILTIGTDRAYSVLEQALAKGTERSRQAIMQSLGAVRDRRATPLFAYVLRHVDHRGVLRPIYAHAIELLGALEDPDGVSALKEALYRGEWWAPRRTAALRGAAAAALARIGTPEAVEVLREALNTAPRGVRAAVRAAGNIGVSA